MTVVRRPLLVSAVLLCASLAYGAGPLPWLSVDGPNRMVVDSSGREVQLKGFNLGNWLVQEIWMSPIAIRKAPAGYDKRTKRIQDHISFWSVIQERLGKDAMHKAQNKWREVWITDADFARMKKSGCNHVRLPFLYDTLLGDDLAVADIEKVQPADYPDSKLDFTWLDKTVRMAKNHGMYVVIDMHGAPGRQSNEHHTGKEHSGRLYRSDHAKAWCKKLWMAIAKRYMNEPAVAGYDLLNEPRALKKNKDLNVKQIHDLHAVLYETVRKVDQKHIIIIEDGYAGCNNLPDPADMGWDNVMLSYHAYPQKNEGLGRITRKTLGEWELKDILQRGSPMYLGEWNLEMGQLSSSANFSQAVAVMKQKSVSWSFWSYKIVPEARKSWKGTHWAWLRPDNTFPAYLDPFSDDLPTLLKKIESYKSENLTVSPAVSALLK